ncbi:hypothetical protein, partial [Streptomyces formicae]
RKRAAQDNVSYAEARRRQASEPGAKAVKLALLVECEAGIIEQKSGHDTAVLREAQQLAGVYGLTEVQMTYFRLAIRVLYRMDSPYRHAHIGQRMSRRHVEDALAKAQCTDLGILRAIRPVVECIVQAHNGGH